MRLPRNRAARAGLAVLALLAAVNVLAAVIDAVAPSPSGPASSSFATKSQGLAAWAALAEREGLRVRALRAPPSRKSLGGGGTVAVMDAGQLSRDEARALRAFAERGGRVVAGGAPSGWTRTLLDGDPPKWDDNGPETARTVAAAPEAAGVRRVRTAGDGRWTGRAPDQKVLAGDEGALLLVARAGRGRIALLAD